MKPGDLYIDTSIKSLFTYLLLSSKLEEGPSGYRARVWETMLLDGSIDFVFESYLTTKCMLLTCATEE